MKLLLNLASLALKCTTGLSDSTVNLLTDRFSDTSKRMSVALTSATERAWRTLEISLAGSSWLERAKGLLVKQEEKVLRGQIQAFLASHVAADMDRHGAPFRQSCLKELQQARKAKVIPGGDLPLREAAAAAESFARYTNPQQAVAAELKEVSSIAKQLEEAGYRNLGLFVALCPAPGPYPLLVIAVRYFFRREIEDDPRLAAAWQFQQLEGLTQAQEVGFQQLHDAIRKHGAKIERLLDDVLEVVTETRDDVRLIKAELQQLRELLAAQRAAVPAPAAGPSPQQMIDLYQAVLQAVQCAGNTSGQSILAAPSTVVIGAAAPLAPPQDEVQTLLTRCQALPKQQQRQLPALFRVVGKLKAEEQARGRLFPHLAIPANKQQEPQPQATSVPDEVSHEPRDSSPPSKQPRLVRVQGRPISPIFQASQDAAHPPSSGVVPPGETQPASPVQEPPNKKGAKRLISKLFTEPKKE